MWESEISHQPRGDSIMEPVELSDITRKALDVLAGVTVIEGSGDSIIDYFLHARRNIHLGNEKVAKAMLAALMTPNIRGSIGIHPKLSGRMGSGKSTSATSMIPLIHADYIEAITCSPKALFDSGIRSGKILIVDDVSPNEDFEELLKEVMSVGFHKDTKRKTRDKANKAVVMTIPKGLVFVFTSVTDSKSDQLLNRQTVISLDKNPELDQAFVNYHYAQAITGFKDVEESEEFQVCREMTRLLKEANVVDGKVVDYVVAIPFAGRIEHPRYAIPDRRAIKIFTDYIMAHAVIYQFQREVDENGVILATVDDFNFAVSMMDIGEVRQTAKLTKDEEAVWRHIVEHPGLSEAEISQGMRKANSLIHRCLYGEGEKNSGIWHKAPVNVEEVYSDGSKTRSKVWTAIGTLDTVSAFAILRPE